jgi:hypothetical protein
MTDTAHGSLWVQFDSNLSCRFLSLTFHGQLGVEQFMPHCGRDRLCLAVHGNPFKHVSGHVHPVFVFTSPLLSQKRVLAVWPASAARQGQRRGCFYACVLPVQIFNPAKACTSPPSTSHTVQETATATAMAWRIGPTASRRHLAGVARPTWSRPTVRLHPGVPLSL